MDHLLKQTSTSAKAAGDSASVNSLLLPGFTEVRQAFHEIRDDENAHVKFLKDALTQAGVTPRPKPTFKGLTQHSAWNFAALSRTFENVGVGASLLAAPAISSKEYLAAAGSILTIETGLY